jgi:hypothetical protein
MSSLARIATELTGVLHGVVRCLNEYDSPLGSDYAQKLSPLVLRFEHAVIFQCDRKLAASILAVIDRTMHTINGAATKGEHQIFPDESDLLNHYWNLNKIFSEIEFETDSLSYNWQTDKRPNT